MKKGYTVILNLRYTKEIEIKTEKEDEEEIKEDVRQSFIQDIINVTGARDLLERYLKVVRVKRNWSESDMELMPWEVEKPYLVQFSARYSGLNVTVLADCEEDAEERAREEKTTCFVSEDGKTECEVFKYELSQVLEIKEEKENAS